MQESKYFYKGIPLAQYCKENDINVDTIRARIWKKKKSPKYANYTEQEIVNMAVEAYGSAVKYMYKGMSLRQYCLENDINIGTINSRIAKLKKKRPDLTNEELVIATVDEFENKNFRFYYDGIPLKEYCELHPEINYNTIRTYINREKEKNPDLSDDELIEQYIAKEHKGIYSHYYLGIPLKQYCEENGLSYRNIISYMSRYRNTDNFKNLSGDEFVEAIMDKYQPFEPKYLYKGKTLREYCLENDLSYYSVVSFVKRKLAKGSSKSIDDLIDEGITTINRYGIIYYYKGMPLKDYAQQNNLNASSIRCAILRKQLKSDKPLQEIVNECVESYQKFSIKYFYNGIPLLTYCKNIGLNYNTIIQKYLYEYADNKDMSIDEAIKQIVDYYLEHPPVKTKYYFNNQSLTRFCDINGYPYLSIWRRIRTLQNKEEVLSDEQIIETAIKKYEDRLQIDRINQAFNKLENNEINAIEEIKEICEFLKIDFENVNDLVNMAFTYNQAVNMIWYFYDEKINDDYKMITDKRIKDIFSLIDKLYDSNVNIKDFKLYDLIGIYKSELYDSRNEILLKQEKYISKTILSLCKSYGIEVNSNNYQDFENKFKYYFLIVIDRIHLNTYRQIIKYIKLSVVGYFKSYLTEYMKQNYSLPEKIENTVFSENMMEVLSNLLPEDLAFIMLKFQENYTDSELAEHFKISIAEVQEKETEIFTEILNSEQVYKIQKS